MTRRTLLALLAASLTVNAVWVILAIRTDWTKS